VLQPDVRHEGVHQRHVLRRTRHHLLFARRHALRRTRTQRRSNTCRSPFRGFTRLDSGLTRSFAHASLAHTSLAHASRAPPDARVCAECTTTPAVGVQAGHAPGSLPYNTSGDPGHMCDDETSNTFRALRFVSASRGNKLYAEFTRLSDWHFSEPPFVEVFDLDADPGQLVNLASRTPPAELAYYREALRRQWQCVGSGCG
jgi:hypothetical protein